MAAVPLTFCEACRQYRAPWRGRLPAFCAGCGRPVTQPDRARIEADLDRIRYLLDEVHAWSRTGLIDHWLRKRLCGPYEAELELVARHLDEALPCGERPTPPGCHETQVASGAFCADCGADLAAWRLERSFEVASSPAPALAAAATALPASTAPELAAVGTALPTSIAPELMAMRTALPASTAPELAAVGIALPASTAPELMAMGTALPASTAPELAAVETALPTSIAPELAAMRTALPTSTAPALAAAVSALPASTAPELMAMETALPASTTPELMVAGPALPAWTTPELMAVGTALPTSTTPVLAAAVTAPAQGLALAAASAITHEPGTAIRPPSVLAEERPAAAHDPVAEPDGRATRLLRELRPVFYENLILFLGAFLVFAGSIYFAVYFWDRLGRLGPLVAGGLLAVYGLGFAAIGYLLQRRYRAELSARVLYGVATAILPVASTLLGEPTRAGAGIGALAAGIVLGFCIGSA